MDVECTREKLSQAALRASRIVSSRPSLPILSHILCQTTEGQLSLFSTDLELGLTTSLGAKVATEGSVVVPARSLVDFLTNNTDPTIHLISDGPHLELKSAHMKARLSGLDQADFPTPPVLANTKTLELPAKTFLEAVKKVVIAPAVEDTRPVLTGVLLSGQDGVLTVVATDSFRLAEQTLALPAASDIPTLIIPSRTIQELLRVASGEETGGSIKMELEEHQCTFTVGQTKLLSRLIDGAFPSYQEIIPKSFATTATLKRAELLNLVKAANVFSREAGASIKAAFSSEGYIQVRSPQGQFGQIETKMEAVVEGEAVESAFNAKFLLDVLAVLSNETIIFELNGKTTPAIIRVPGDDSYKYVMMPLRIEG